MRPQQRESCPLSSFALAKSKYVVRRIRRIAKLFSKTVIKTAIQYGGGYINNLHLYGFYNYQAVKSTTNYWLVSHNQQIGFALTK